jgi:hypothetical protein
MARLNSKGRIRIVKSKSTKKAAQSTTTAVYVADDDSGRGDKF